MNCHRHIPIRRCVTIVAFLSITLVAGLAAAQLGDPVRIRQTYLPSVEDPGEAAGISSFEGAFGVPVRLSEKNILIPGLAYQYTRVSNDIAGAAINDLHETSFELGFVSLLSAKWTLALRSSNGVSGSFSGRDPAYFGNVLGFAMHKISPKLRLGYGGLAQYSRGRFLAYPSLFVAWNPTSYFSLTIVVPAVLKATLKPWDWLDISAKASLFGDKYEVECADGDCGDHVSVLNVLSGVEAAVNVWGPLWFTVYGGTSVFRTAELRDANGEAVVGSSTLKNTPFIQTSLLLRRKRK